MSTPSGWSRGYPVAEPYPAAWHAFQSPAHLAAACALMGVAWEVGPETPMQIAEIGCGSGYTANVLAAGNPNAQVLGLDYNPAHVAEARSFAAAAGLGNARFEATDLAELDDAALDRLPEFDLVTVHGLWSWVADPVREGVLRLLRRRLKPGGVVLITYNALPGAGGALGLSRLVRGALQAGGSTAEGLGAARAMVQKLVAAEARHLPDTTWRSLLLGELGEARAGYLLHEFITEHWRPSFFADVQAAMATARCDFVGSASLDENFPAMSLNPAQQEIWHAAPDETARQLVLDLCVPRAFRRDIYVRGLRRMPRNAAVAAIPVAAITHAPDGRILRSQAGEARLPPAVMQPVQAALEAGPQEIGALLALPGCGSVTPTELLALLIGSGSAMPLWRRPGSGPHWEAAQAAARRLNAVAARRLAAHGVGTARLALASPALAGGMSVDAMELAVAHMVAEGVPAQPATLVQRLLPAGDPPPDGLRQDLEQRVGLLLAHRGPVWRALGIA
ncbi:class I SAM-dependent methyltransferase [Falsiroseomonas selenitidurans]|uniref:Methyltransferase domain-containing protein n=1 Tax=Falsiroseomonas selenitidurans TaxID=2716335 RepID=A0ABX1EA86_9PROT|nr:class I SAM-dependent methyltransferase [Falsiroseomonas selenitidurans]NKC34097.1 methyltransferase domain-containing protein [Falsiroseomonas selenitidurans]